MSRRTKLREQFPFINHNLLRSIVYQHARTQKMRIGNTVFDRSTYNSNPQMVLDALARDTLALKIVGHLHKQLNRKRALYYPYFNRTLSKLEIQNIEKSIKHK